VTSIIFMVLGLIATILGVIWISVVTKREVNKCLKEIEAKLKKEKKKRRLSKKSQDIKSTKTEETSGTPTFPFLKVNTLKT